MKSLFSIFKRGLEKTATKVSRSIRGMFGDVEVWKEENFEELEAALISADFGVGASLKIVSDIRDRYERGQIATAADIFAVADETVTAILSKNMREIKYAPSGTPTVIMFVGVNGSGKTTTIGKLAARFRKEGKTVILAAGDTFRAAAVDQLKLWGERTGSTVVAAAHGADPASVAFDAVKAAVARNADILLIDTAGRQHNRKTLMDELGKIVRSVDKACPGAPHEVWLTVDASIGANALSQAREFSQTAGVSALVLTKLDGSGKGGMAVALNYEFDLPTLFAGLGEQPDDLQPFDPEYYADALFGREASGE